MPTIAPTTIGGEPVAGSVIRPCTATDVELSAQWVHAYIAQTRTGPSSSLAPLQAMMDGTLSMTNTSTTACTAPTDVKVAILGAKGPLNLPSHDATDPAGGYMVHRPLAPKATAVAPLSWSPSWCGPDPGPTPTLLVTVPPDPPLKVQVVDSLPDQTHAPSCDPGQAASVIVVGAFGQAPRSTPPPTSTATGQYGSGQSVTLTPSTGLHDGQVIHVTGTAYKPNENLVVTECVDVGPSTYVQDCDLATYKAAASDANGNVSMDFQVIVGPVGAVKAMCGQPNPCLVAVTTQSYTPTDAAHADIRFGG
jgi:hypothetical protein